MGRRAKSGVKPPAAPVIYLPGHIEDTRRVIARCNVPIGPDETCPVVFYEGEEALYQRHVGDCASRHMDVIRAQSPTVRFPMTDPQSWDPEVDEHLGKVGKQMVKEGRLTVKPSERAGFS